MKRRTKNVQRYRRNQNQGGDGGNGAVTFHREKYVASGGPDGGDGGRGGSVVFVADDGVSTLSDFRYKRKYVAENGQKGGPNRCGGNPPPRSGRQGALGHPAVRSADRTADGRYERGRALCGRSGGRGGWGTPILPPPPGKLPRFAKPGVPGEAVDIRLELKLLADVGLVGFPNVGKSSLLSVVSEAKPQVADYHFTTLSPVLGWSGWGRDLFCHGGYPRDHRGASEGVGLGHEFLRHIDRCRLLVHVVDVASSEGRDPLADLETINRELAAFNPELASRPMLVAGNKCDLAEDSQVEAFAAAVREKGI